MSRLTTSTPDTGLFVFTACPVATGREGVDSAAGHCYPVTASTAGPCLGGDGRDVLYAG